MFHFENIFRLRTAAQQFEQLFLFKLGMNSSAQAFGVEGRKFDNRSLLDIALMAKTFKITRGKYKVTQKSWRQFGMNGSVQSFWGLKYEWKFHKHKVQNCVFETLQNHQREVQRHSQTKMFFVFRDLKKENLTSTACEISL